MSWVTTLQIALLMVLGSVLTGTVISTYFRMKKEQQRQ